MNKDLSQEEKDQIEEEFIRAEEEREASERRERKSKKEKIKSDISFEAVRAFSVFAAGFLLAASFYPPMVGPALGMAALWIIAVSVCILRMRSVLQEGMAEPDGAGNPDKRPGFSREH